MRTWATLQLFATLGATVPHGPQPNVLMGVSNVGRRAVTLSAVGFTVGLLPRWSRIVPVTHIVMPQSEGVRIQKRLGDGESHQTVDIVKGA